MNCPRCKHGSAPISRGFCCGNCRAGFLDDATVASGEPLVHENVAGNYEIRRQLGAQPRAWISAALFLALGSILLKKTGESRSTGWLATVFLGLAVLQVYRLFRDRFSRILVQPSESGIVVMDGPFGRLRPTQLERQSIDGFWVKCILSENEIIGYALMVDQHGTRSRTVLDSVEQLTPVVILAEKLATRLGVPSDTRGGDFR
jgi:hypothetical protein